MSEFTGILFLRLSKIDGNMLFFIRVGVIAGLSLHIAPINIMSKGSYEKEE
jgi:hypothetical protein